MPLVALIASLGLYLCIFVALYTKISELSRGYSKNRRAGTLLAGYNEIMPKRLAFVTVLIAALALILSRAPVSASSPTLKITPFPTPTPGADGIIRYKVKPGDSLWHIAAVAGISVEKLRALNNMEPNQTIRVGEILILGIGVSERPSPTPGGVGQQATATPTPTKIPGEGKICILLYNDRDGNGVYEEDTEAPLPDGAISISGQRGETAHTAKTGNDFVCFDHLPEGQYTISMGVPPGYNPTTKTTARVDLQAGDTTYVTFGAQKALPPPTQPQPQKHSPVLGIIGAVFILLALAIWWYGRRLTSSRR